MHTRTIVPRSLFESEHVLTTLHSRDTFQFAEMAAGVPLDKDAVAASAFRCSRIYVCPFAVCKFLTIGKGFVFAQSTSPIEEFQYDGHSDRFGCQLSRSVTYRYATLEDYDKMCEQEPQMRIVEAPLRESVAEYDPQQHMNLVFLTGNFLTCLKIKLVPDFGMSSQLGVEHAERETLQMNLDVEDDDDDE